MLMWEEFLNKKLTRVLIGIAVALPFTALSLPLGWYGLVMGEIGFAGGDLISIAIGLITILGWIGITGGWRRLLQSSKDMPSKEQNRIRIMLFCGLASSLSLLLGAIYLKFQEGIIGCILICLLNVFFISATPKK